MDPGGQEDGMNMTRALEALAPYLHNPRQTVIRIEAFVVLTAALLFLQLILGSCRRRSGHWLVQGALWIAYTLYFPLITYTLGQMVSSPVKNALYPLWAILLFSAVGCTNSITAYDLEDNKQWKRYLFELLQHYVYLIVIFQLLNPTHPTSLSSQIQKREAPQPIVTTSIILVVVVFLTNLVRVIAGWMVTNSTPSAHVADYMSRQGVDARGAQKPFNPNTMKGYRYLVRGGYQASFFHELMSRICRTEVSRDGNNTITIDEIFDMKFDDSLLNTSGGSSRLKDVCLSFALSHLLKRRFFGMECAEARLPQTRKFVLEGLLSEEDGIINYTRAFHIIEVELGFLYDLFFTKYAALFHMEISFLVMVVLKLISISICWVFLLRYSPIIKTLNPVIEVGTTTADVTITIVIMGTLCFIEALQVILYLTSDWATVSLACSYTRGSTQKLIPSIIWFIRRFNLSRCWKWMIARHVGKSIDSLNLFGYWQKKMGQSSVIEGCLRLNPYSVFPPIDFNMTGDLLWKLLLNSPFIAYGLIDSMIVSRKTSKVVPDLVKREIISCLQKCSIGVPLTNGETALRCNGVLQEFSGTLKNKCQAETMVLWHIATEYCDIATSDEAEGHESGGTEKEKLQIANYQQVATTLSRYCAYLMSFVPDLLPGNSVDTLSFFTGGLLEAREVLFREKPSRDILLRAINDSINRGDQYTIFIEGLKLGKKLEEIEDNALRWKVMAEFWAETIVYIAPSENVQAHMERLAQGGEFLTHLWALLSHAGILRRCRKRTPEDIV